MWSSTLRRRRMLVTIGFLLWYFPAAVRGTAANTVNPSNERAPQAPVEHSHGGPQLSGVYRATVDRVVDDSYVVLLLERDGRVIDQVVLSAREYPELSARDSVVVSLLWGHVLAVW